MSEKKKIVGFIIKIFRKRVKESSFGEKTRLNDWWISIVRIKR